jgi:hypothetical protein
MSQETKPPTPAEGHPAPPLAPFAAFLSYLVPGLGQISQGRVGKGLLFMVCLYGLFFYGMELGQKKNVYLPRGRQANPPWRLPRVAHDLYQRPQFAGQFWIGIAAWPAIWQYYHYDDRLAGDRFLGTYQRMEDEEKLNELQRLGDKTWDLAWVYTVIAGVLNLLVIYDAWAGPAHLRPDDHFTRPKEAPAP